jgi:hypothetical protein
MPSFPARLVLAHWTVTLTGMLSDLRAIYF